MSTFVRRKKNGELLLVLAFEPVLGLLPAMKVCGKSGKIEWLLWYEVEVRSVDGESPARLLQNEEDRQKSIGTGGAPRLD